ncbi:MAG: MFS transporter [Kofleriaceae bacterium]|nr:MFS transporter [Kofleriaceae bacterium]
MTTDRPGLWGHADFLRLWAAQAISAFGSRISRTALPIIAITTLHQSESHVALLWSLYLVPGLVLALFAGGIVDRSRKRRILIGADVFRAVVFSSITVAWWLGALSMVHLVVAGALVGAASALFQIADVAYLPALVGKRYIAEGNAKLEATEGVAEVTGPATAGVLIGVLGAPVAVIVDAATYVWSAVMLGRIRTKEPPAAPVPSAASSTWQTTRDLRTGMHAVFGHPYVRPIIVTLVVWSIAGGFFTALYTLFCFRTLGLDATTFGIIVAMGGIGSLLGAMLSRRLVHSIGLGPTLITSAIISLAGALLIPLASGSYTRILVLLGAHQLISDCFSVAFIIQAVTLRQTVLPRELLGRANAAIHICTSGVIVITTLAAGWLAQLTTIREAVWIGVSIGLIAPIFLWPLRGLRSMPEAASSSTELARATST